MGSIFRGVRLSEKVLGLLVSYQNLSVETPCCHGSEPSNGRVQASGASGAEAESYGVGYPDYLVVA